MPVSLTVLLRGVLATLVAVLASWLSTATPVLATAAESPSGTMCTYYAPAIAVAPVDNECERGIAAYNHAAMTDNSVALRSDGPLESPSNSATSANYAFDAPGIPAQVDSVAAMTVRSAGATRATPAVLVLSRVAAKTADEALVGVDDMLGGLAKGRSSGVRTV